MTARDDTSEVLGLLRRRYQPKDARPGIFAAEIEAPGGGRRADAIWVPTSIAGGVRDHEIHGHEVKVSRSDLLAELKDPTKADPWSQFCTRWWLVLGSLDLAENLEIPTVWGVMAVKPPATGKLRRALVVVRDAPPLTPVDQAPAFARIARWLHYERIDDQFKANLKAGRLEYESAQLRAELERAKDARSDVRDPASEHVRDVLRLVQQSLDDRGYSRDRPSIHGRPAAEDVAAAIISVMEARALASTVAWTVQSKLQALMTLLNQDQLERTRSQAADLHAELGKVAAPERRAATPAAAAS